MNSGQRTKHKQKATGEKCQSGLKPKRRKSSETPLLDEIWPVHPTKAWPEGLSLRREDMDIYEDRI